MGEEKLVKGKLNAKALRKPKHRCLPAAWGREEVWTQIRPSLKVQTKTQEVKMSKAGPKTSLET